MADKPSRALVLYGDGLARFINPSHTHLHSFASKAACGFLSLPTSPPSESEDDRIVREFAVLLDACEACPNSVTLETLLVEYKEKSSQKDDTSMPTVSQRFMGMKAAVVTNNPCLKSFAGKLGLLVLPFDDLDGNGCSLSGSSVGVVTSRLLNLLGFQDGKTLETSELDLVFVHIGAGETVSGLTSEAIANDVEYFNCLVGSVLQTAHPGSEIGSRLHLSLVMSFGSVTEDDPVKFSVLVSKDQMKPHLAVLIPRQSYTMRGEKPRDEVRHYCPMLIAQWQYAVTRMDATETFSFEDFKQRGGNLVIPADRFLHEVAFKLWKAPKYGA